MNCRHCGASLRHTFLDLGFAPLSNGYLTAAELVRPEKYHPLKIKICDRCWLVQTEGCPSAHEIFDADYAYFSSTSTIWLAHAACYAEKAIRRFRLGRDSLVIEVASNDGYLLKNFLAAGIPCLGIEPTASTAAAAEQLGIAVIREFFDEQLGKQLAAKRKLADLIIGNNIYAHVPDIDDFTRGLKAALKADGIITLEFPHVLRMIDGIQFDTVYHEHFSYLSLHTAAHIFECAGLRVWDVETLSTHGGSLRVYGCHAEHPRATSVAVTTLLADEARRGLKNVAGYVDFQSRADRVKDDLLLFLLEQKRAGKTVAGYGAAAKGSTLLNYAGVKPDLLPFVCDAAPAKQGKFMPGSHIPILPPAALTARPPDYLLILPWNLADEIKHANAGLTAGGTKFVTAVPALEIC